MIFRRPSNGSGTASGRNTHVADGVNVLEPGNGARADRQSGLRKLTGIRAPADAGVVDRLALKQVDELASGHGAREAAGEPRRTTVVLERGSGPEMCQRPTTSGSPQRVVNGCDQGVEVSPMPVV
jgi:hypothetical protein